jgi:hypothetical protein
VSTETSFGRGYQGPPGPHQVEAYQEYWQARTFACAVRKMPLDWPLFAAAREEATTHCEAAKRLDPNVPPLNLPDW